MVHPMDLTSLEVLCQESTAPEPSVSDRRSHTTLRPSHRQRFAPTAVVPGESREPPPCTRCASTSRSRSRRGGNRRRRLLPANSAWRRGRAHAAARRRSRASRRVVTKSGTATCGNNRATTPAHRTSWSSDHHGRDPASQTLRATKQQ